MEYFNYCGSLITNDASWAHKIKSRVAIQQEKDSLEQQTLLNFKDETSKILHLQHSFIWCSNFRK
jgi:hypothetical protein